MKWLGGKDATRPKVLARAGDAAGRVRVEGALGTGSAVLASGGGEFRLAWTAGDADPARFVAPGAWKIRNTWLERSAGGASWSLAASGPALDAFAAKAGESATLSVDPAVRFAGRVRRDGKDLVLEFSLAGDRKRGVSVWRDGRRIPVSWRVLGRDGKVLAEGPASYG